MTVLQDAMFQVPHLPLAVTQVSKETIKAFSHSKKVGGYLLGRTLGVGSFAKVKEGLHISTGEKAAVKIIDKKRAKNDNYVRKNLRREGKLLQAVRHPNIVALLEIMETDNSYYLVTELCKGGDLMEYISARKRLQEKEVLKFIRQIVSAVDYLHKVGIIHRDLKIENLLLDGNNDIKLIDFGLSNFVKVVDSSDGIKEGELCSTQCGSPAYAAPELLNHEQYGLQVDSWSIGVNMFAMLTGGLPFTVEPFNIKALYVKMRDGQMNPVPEGLTKECRDLLRKFLTPDPSKRVTIEQALIHPWITHGNSKPVQRVPCPNKLKTNDLNTEILSHMSENLGFRMGEVIKFVTCNTPSSACATYHLYLTRLRRYQEDQSKSTKKSNTTRRRSGVLDQRFPINSSNDTNILKNNKTQNNNDNEDDDIDNNDNDLNTDRNNEEEEIYSPITSPSPQPKFQEAANSFPSRKGGTSPTASRAEHTQPATMESPRSERSDTSDRKENKIPQARENSFRFEESPHTNRFQSPRPTNPVNRTASLRTQQDDKATTGLVNRPRLYKRRGEANLTSIYRDKFQGEGQETIEILDVTRPSRDVPGGSTLYRSDGKQDLALSQIVSPPQTARQAPRDQFSSKRGSDAGVTHISNGDGTNEGSTHLGAVNNKGFRVVSSGGIPSTKRARDASKSPVNFLSRLSDTHHQYSSRQDKDKKGTIGDNIFDPVEGSAKPTTRSYLQNKRASMLARRAAALKELKPAMNHSQDGEKVQGRLQDTSMYGRVNNSNKNGRINPQAGKIIPRPFVPFRSAQERPSGLSSSYPHHLGPPQKAKTAETLTVRHETSGVSPSRASGPPVESSEALTTGPPRPFIVRKRLVKRHRLGEVQPLQPGLLHDIEQTITATSFSSADAIFATNPSRKTNHMNDSLS